MLNHLEVGPYTILVAVVKISNDSFKQSSQLVEKGN